MPVMRDNRFGWHESTVTARGMQLLHPIAAVKPAYIRCIYEIYVMRFARERVLADKEVVVNAPMLIRREFCRTSRAHGRGEATRGEPSHEKVHARTGRGAYTRGVYTYTHLQCVNLDTRPTVPCAARSTPCQTS